jgi:hypothetical protein
MLHQMRLHILSALFETLLSCLAPLSDLSGNHASTLATLRFLLVCLNHADPPNFTTRERCFTTVQAHNISKHANLQQLQRPVSQPIHDKADRDLTDA